MADLKEWKSRIVSQGSSGEQVHSILADWQSAEDTMEQKFTDIQQLKAEICHCVPVYQPIAIKGLIAMGFPFCPRCGGKLSAV